MITKKWIKISTIGLLTLITAFCSFGLTKLFKFLNDESTPKTLVSSASDTFDFAEGMVAQYESDIDETQDIYDYSKFTTYKIGSELAFSNFVKSANDYEVDFTGCTVYLSSSINFSGVYSIGYFNGAFDGQGKSLKSMSGDVQANDNIRYYGLFESLGGTVNNTKFIDFSYNIVDKGNSWAVGVIAGANNGVIENCVVDDCSFSRSLSGTAYVAPICGGGEGSIINCMVTGTYEVEGNIDPAYFAATAYSSTALNCIFAATLIGGNFGASDDWELKTSFGYVMNYANVNDAIEAFAKSGDASAEPASGTTWYIYKEGYGYNGDSSLRIYLRDYITWRTFAFQVEKTTDINGNTIIPGTVTHSSLQVPSGCDTVTKRGNILKIYGETIKATGEPGFEFVKWDINTRLYTAVFEYRDIELNFSGCDSSTNYVCYWTDGENSEIVTDTDQISFYVPYNQCVEVSFYQEDMFYNKTYTVSKDGCYVSVVLKFYGRMQGDEANPLKDYEIGYIITSEDVYIESVTRTDENNNETSIASDCGVNMTEKFTFNAVVLQRDWYLGII